MGNNTKNLNIPGFDREAKELLGLEDLKPEAVDLLIKLSDVMVKNPYEIFREKNREAKIYLDANNGHPKEPYYKGPVREVIDASDYEFNQMMEKALNLSQLWGESEKLSILEVLRNMIERKVRAELGLEKKKREEKGDTDDSTLVEYLENKSQTDRRENFLPKLAEDTRLIREKLVSTVHGQDHAVRTVADGLFSAQFTAMSEKKRKRPLAVFTFAGPPGVGKTLIAETLHEIMDIPYKRFDMSEYSLKDSESGLVGFEATWGSSQPGMLTSFVKKHPRCILLFDEIEKAHPHVLKLFYQLLDDGCLTDKFVETGIVSPDGLSASKKKIVQDFGDPKVLFKNTIIIFTTNAGRPLYENDPWFNAASVSPKAVINAIKNDKNPETGEPYFPAALSSRLNTGFPVMFNHLTPIDLESAIGDQFVKAKTLLKKQYGIGVEWDEETKAALLYAAGGQSDARSLVAKAKRFFETEYLKMIESGVRDYNKYKKLVFRTEFEKLADDSETKSLFTPTRKLKLVIYSNELVNRRITALAADRFDIFTASTTDDLLLSVQEHNADMAVIDIKQGGDDNSKTVIGSFAAKRWEAGKRAFTALREKFPYLPVYILQTKEEIGEDLMNCFYNAGASGKLIMPAKSDKNEKFLSELAYAEKKVNMGKAATMLSRGNRMLHFETVPKVSDNDTIEICLRDFEIVRVTDGDDSADLLSAAEMPTETFDSVVGAEKAKEELKYFVDYMNDPREFIASGQEPPRGVLLYGAPGTGKTMLARALANACKATFIPTKASDIVKSSTMRGPDAVKSLFAKARKYAPSIIFIDEVDTIGKMRMGYGGDEEATLNAFLAEMGGFKADPNAPVFVLCATNFGIEEGEGIGVLDPAFVRRFDRRIRMELPTKSERESFLTSKLKEYNGSKLDEELTKVITNVAKRSAGLSLAVLANVIATSKRAVFKLVAQAKENGVSDKDRKALMKITGAILDAEYKNEIEGEKDKSIDQSFVERTAYHEAGHAFMHWFTGHTPTYLTVEARRKTLGYMMHDEAMTRKPNWTKKELFDRVRCFLAGRAAETVFYPDDGMDTGASGDLRQATITIKRMIVSWGMDEKYGIATIEDDSPELTKHINETLNHEMEVTKKSIEANKDIVEGLAKLLIEKGSLIDDELNEYFAKFENHKKKK